MASSCNQPMHKAWSVESTLADTNNIREALRLYNVPFETLRRHVTGAVENGCRPGPDTVLMADEEDQLAS